MFKIYDTNYSYIGRLDSYKDAYTEEELARGVRRLVFRAPCKPEMYELLQEEFYIETQDYNYIIKEVNYTGNSFFEVRAAADIEEIAGSVFRVFDCFDRSLSLAYEYCLQRTSWVVNYHATNRAGITYQLANTNALEMIYYIANDYQQELWFDTKEKVLHVYDKMGSTLGAYYSNELKLEKLEKQSSTYDFATVLIPIGKDGLTISNINNGHDYLENFQYCDKYIEKIWINEDYDVAEKLRAAAEIYLDEVSQPKASYKLKVSDLGPTVQLGDEIMLVDKIKRIKQKQRVVKLTRFLNQPEEDSLEISNIQEDFARNFVVQQKKIEKQIAYIREVLAQLN